VLIHCYVQQAVKQLTSFFRTYTTIDRVVSLARGVQEVQAVVRAQIMKDFEEAFASEGGEVGRNFTLVDACAVIDALGDDARSVLCCLLSVARPNVR
jgi:hypothetical protein